jgi:hypothetical protein
MKKYKLIKVYPGIDTEYISVGDTFTEQGNNSYVQEEKKQLFRYCVSKREVENCPEFWEEVKEKEWEIIEVRRVDGSDYTKDKDKIRRYLTTLVIGNQIYWFIHSIKRLSDGEVFTIGDTIYCPNILQRNEATIISFEMRGESILVKTNWHLIGADLRSVKKIEKVTGKGPLVDDLSEEITIEDKEQFIDKWYNPLKKESKVAKETVSTLRPEYEHLIVSGRAQGNTTRQTDLAIQLLFQGKRVLLHDHHEYGNNERANKNLFQKVRERLICEHHIPRDKVKVDKIGIYWAIEFKEQFCKKEIKEVELKKERLIDEIFNDPETGAELKCIESLSGCQWCFYSKPVNNHCENRICSHDERSDKKDVKFVIIK